MQDVALEGDFSSSVVAGGAASLAAKVDSKNGSESRSVASD
jgi:hypothetical protein